MPFTLPEFRPPDFTRPPFTGAPLAVFEPARAPGIAPDDFHATSIYPEYFQVKEGVWLMPADSRMDCVVVLEPGGSLSVKEFRNLEAGDRVACGRPENAREGIYVHSAPFGRGHARGSCDKFAFRTQVSRETSFSYDYDELYRLLRFEREKGFILWVLGPAVIGQPLSI